MHANTLSRNSIAAFVLLIAVAFGQRLVFTQLVEAQRTGVEFVDAS